MKSLLKNALICFCLVLMASCGPKPGQDVGAIISQGQQLVAEGKPGQAVSLLNRYYRSEAYASERPRLLTVLVAIECGEGKGDAAQKRFLKATEKNPGLAQQVLGMLCRTKQWMVVDSLLTSAETRMGKVPEWQGLLANVRTDLILGRDGYKAALSHVSRAITTVPDAAAARDVQKVGEATVTAGNAAAAEALYEIALNGAPARVKTREAGARGWVRSAARRGIPDEVVVRLERLDREQLDTMLIVDLISESYNVLLGRGTQDTFRRIYALCEKQNARGIPATDRPVLGGVMLDISYYLNDFELSLKLIEQGMMDLDADQKQQMVAKIRAHIAMKKGQPQEAVKYLREFMGYIAKLNRTEVDPVNNCRVTPEMILGLNSKRIGDLLKSAGDGAGARQAYGEARDYYSKALKLFPDVKSAEHAKVVKEMAEIPNG